MHILRKILWKLCVGTCLLEPNVATPLSMDIFTYVFMPVLAAFQRIDFEIRDVRFKTTYSMTNQSLYISTFKTQLFPVKS